MTHLSGLDDLCGVGQDQRGGRSVAAFVMVVALVVGVPATSVAQSQRFPDVPPDHYAFVAVEWAAEVGVTTGYADGTFQPERSLIKRHAVVFMERYYDEILQAEESEDFTRGDMMVLLKAINDGTLRDTESDSGWPAEEGASQRFPDVPPDHYAFVAVEWAAEVGVTTGYADGTFQPERSLIKRHAVVFMERYYDEILQAEESEDFTRGDMMVLLKAINDGTAGDLGADRSAAAESAVCPSTSAESATATTPPAPNREPPPWFDDPPDAAHTAALETIDEITDLDPSVGSYVAGLSWVADGVIWREVEVLDALLSFTHFDQALARRVLGPDLKLLFLESDFESISQLAGCVWLTDGLNMNETMALVGMVRIAKQAPQWSGTAIDISGLVDGVSDEESYIPEILLRLVQNSEEIVSQIVEYDWLDDSVIRSERFALSALGMLSATDRELAMQAVDYEWVVDGITWNEMQVLEDLSRASSMTRSYLRDVTHLPPEMVTDFGWMSDGLDANEMRAFVALAEIAQLAPQVYEQLSSYSWLVDEVSERESKAVRRLKDVVIVDVEVARQIVDMDILKDPLADRELYALLSLLDLASIPERFALLTSQAWFDDGLNEEDVAFVALASEISRYSIDSEFPSLISAWDAEHTTVSLPLAGEVRIWVISHDTNLDLDDTLSWIEDAVHASETVISVQFPTDDVILWIPEPGMEYGPQGGYHADEFMVTATNVIDVHTLYHETAHYYSLGLSFWFTEGGADFIAAYTLDRVGERSLESSQAVLQDVLLRECASDGFDKIIQLLDYGESHGCNYWLGNNFLISLLGLLGEEATSAALKELYLQPELKGRDLTEEDFYRTFLNHTPSPLKDEFRDLYERLHGGSYPGMHASDTTRRGPSTESVLRPDEGMRVRMARAAWSSGFFQAALYRALLQELGYEVSDPAEMTLDPADAYTAMAQGEFDFWANGWYPLHRSFGYYAETLGDGSAVRDHIAPVGEQMISGGLQGFLITKSIAEEHAISTLDDLDGNPAALAEFDETDPVPGNGSADIYGCPQNWPCADIIDSMIALSGWSNIRQFTDGYDAMHAEAVGRVLRGEPVVIFTWSPSSYIASLVPGHSVVWLGVERVLDDSNPLGRPGGEDWDQRPGTASVDPAQCPDAAEHGSCRLGWQANDILVTARNSFLEANPAAAKLLELVKLDPIDVSNQIMAQDRGASPADLAARWIADHRDQVDTWLAAARNDPSTANREAPTNTAILMRPLRLPNVSHGRSGAVQACTRGGCVETIGAGWGGGPR